ncbi:MAG: class I SAM-dependent methyltransferase [Geminicoccaceae bacterium]|nr:MAG: class I SAM-dependent methyltransferase [Geminicoccaceae bacterium]
MAARYESVEPAAVNAAAADLIEGGSGLALDIGAGSGRDAAWLASIGYEVVAVEPAEGMRREASRRHSSDRIRWLDDRLPDLGAVRRLGLAFDLVLLSAVWMHVPPADRTRAFRKIVTLLKPGGRVVVSLREGPAEPGRPMWPAPLGEIEALARHHALVVERVRQQDDRLGRSNVAWTSVVMRVPDDGTGAFPLLRGIILNDAKTSTYELGLLRVLVRIADAAPGLAVDHPDEVDAVQLPMDNRGLWVTGRRCPP